MSGESSNAYEPPHRAHSTAQTPGAGVNAASPQLWRPEPEAPLLRPTAQPVPRPDYLSPSSPTSPSHPAPQTPGAAPPATAVSNLMSTTKRDGVWDVPAHSSYTSVMGEVKLDLRQARLSSQVVTININLIMSSLKVYAPPNYRVEFATNDVLSSTKRKLRRGVTPPVDGPLIRITGLQVLSSVVAHQK